jgi:hypothetical protein
MHQECPRPGEAEPAQMGPGVPQFLYEPKAAVDGRKQGRMHGEIDDACEVPIGGVGRIGGSVPADGHGGFGRKGMGG